MNNQLKISYLVHWVAFVATLAFWQSGLGRAPNNNSLIADCKRGERYKAIDLNEPRGITSMQIVLNIPGYSALEIIYRKIDNIHNNSLSGNLGIGSYSKCA